MLLGAAAKAHAEEAKHVPVTVLGACTAAARDALIPLRHQCDIVMPWTPGLTLEIGIPSDMGYGSLRFELLAQLHPHLIDSGRRTHLSRVTS